MLKSNYKKNRDLSGNSNNISDLEKMGVLDWTDSENEE